MLASLLGSSSNVLSVCTSFFLSQLLTGITTLLLAQHFRLCPGSRNFLPHHDDSTLMLK